MKSSSIPLAVLALALALIIGACQSPPENARLADKTTVTTDTDAVGEPGSVEPGGARLWQQTCARCHNYRRPRSRTDEQWKLIVHHMRVRANIPASDAREILRFLQAAN